MLRHVRLRALVTPLVFSALLVAAAPSAVEASGPNSPVGLQTPHPARPVLTLIVLDGVAWSPGSFAVGVANKGPGNSAFPGRVFAYSPGAPTVGAGFGPLKAGSRTKVTLSGIANGRCYKIGITMDPDAPGGGVMWDGVGRTICLDPDGGGPIYDK